MRDYGVIFPALLLAISPLAGVNEYTKIADDICFAQLLSFCIPIISRYHPTKLQCTVGMHKLSYCAIVAIALGVGGMSTFYTITPAAAKEELDIFFNATFPDYDKQQIETLTWRYYITLPPLLALISKIPLWLVGDYVGPRSQIMFSLYFSMISCVLSLVAFFSQFFDVVENFLDPTTRGLSMIVARNILAISLSVGSEAASLYIGDICPQEHIKRATLIATVCVGLGQVSCEALTDKLFFEESLLWLLFVPPLVVLTVALFLVYSICESPVHDLRQAVMKKEIPRCVKQDIAMLISFEPKASAVAEQRRNSQRRRDSTGPLIVPENPPAEVVAEPFSAANAALEYEKQLLNQTRDEIERQQGDGRFFTQTTIPVGVDYRALRLAYFTWVVKNEVWQFYKASPFGSINVAKGCCVTFLVGMTGLIVQMTLVRELLRALGVAIEIDDILDYVTHALIFVVAIARSSLSVEIKMRRDFTISNFVQLILEAIISHLLLYLHSIIWQIILIVVTIIFIFIYATLTLPAAFFLINEAYKDYSIGSLWFSLVIMSTRYLILFGFAPLAKATTLASAYAHVFVYGNLLVFLLLLFLEMRQSAHRRRRNRPPHNSGIVPVNIAAIQVSSLQPNLPV